MKRTANSDVEELLWLNGLSASYGKIKAVDNVSLDVRNGDVVGIIGANGHGKSSLLKAIMGLNHTEGEIRFAGEDIRNTKSFDRVRRGLVLVPERGGFFPGLTIEQNLSVACCTKRARENVNDNRRFIFDIFPVMTERRQQKALTLSGGERKMLAISMGIMTSGKILMIDEPSLGLAPILVSSLYEALSKIKETIPAMLVVEQNVSILKKFAKSLCLIENGKIILNGDVKYVLSSDYVAKAYLGI